MRHVVAALTASCESRCLFCCCPGLARIDIGRCSRPVRSLRRLRQTSHRIQGHGSGSTTTTLCKASGSWAKPSFKDVAQKVQRHFLEAAVPEFGVPYTDALQSFVQAGVAAYRSGYSIASINLQLQMARNTGVAAIDTALQGRQLQQDEIDLRSGWLATVYIALDAIKFPAEDSPGQLGLDQRLDIFARNVVNLAGKGYDMKRVKLQEVLDMDPITGPPRTPLESAVLSQAIRIVFMTLEAARQQRS
ncbi:hypothetical protein WJX72_011205 [[Myrmecia] bisecta]|uniref:Uncharacterized protein n=1 Tax=[Myrmecia] bisecta TaxID=41462 RepID=A0AAW1Q788_9CHLO